MTPTIHDVAMRIYAGFCDTRGYGRDSHQTGEVGTADGHYKGLAELSYELAQVFMDEAKQHPVQPAPESDSAYWARYFEAKRRGLNMDGSPLKDGPVGNEIDPGMGVGVNLSGGFIDKSTK